MGNGQSGAEVEFIIDGEIAIAVEFDGDQESLFDSVIFEFERCRTRRDRGR